MVDVTGAKYDVFSEEFYYRAVKAAYELACAAMYGRGNFEDIEAGSDFLFITENLDKIALLDVKIQEYIWGQVLTFLSEKPEKFNIYYECCPPSVRCTPSVEKTHYVCKINFDPNSIDCNNLLKYVSETGEDSILCMYLSCIEASTAIEFLEDHGFLYKQSSIYLKLRLELGPDIKPEDAYAFLERYKEAYENDYTFRLLLAKYAASAQNLNEEYDWFKARLGEMKPHDAINYVQLLYKHQRWDDLVHLSENRLPNEYMFIVAGFLAKSEDDNHVKMSCNLYQQLIAVDWKRRGLYFNMGVVQRRLGDL